MFNVSFSPITSLFAQTPVAGQPNPLMAMLPFILMFVVFYFLIIVPQKKKQKQHEKMLTELKKGDKVITSGGILGAIVGVKEKTVVLKVGDADTKIEFLKTAVSVVNDKSFE